MRRPATVIGAEHLVYTERVGDRMSDLVGTLPKAVSLLPARSAANAACGSAPPPSHFVTVGGEALEICAHRSVAPLLVNQDGRPASCYPASVSRSMTTANRTCQASFITFTE